MRLVELLVWCVGFVVVRRAEASGNVFADEDEETVRVILGFRGETDDFAHFLSSDRFQKMRFSKTSRRKEKDHVALLHRINAMAVTMTLSELDELLLEQEDDSSLSAFSYIERDTRSRTYSEVTPYGIKAVQGTDSNEIFQESASFSDDCFTVCVVDDGLLLGHPDIPFSTGGSNISGDVFGLDDDVLWYSPSEESDHGTHVTGTILSIGGNGIGVVGVIPQSNNICMLVATVFDEDGTNDTSYIDEAAEWCADQGASVINMSLGATSYKESSAELYQKLFDDGVLVVAAAGNDGKRQYDYPASYDGVVSVAAVDENLEQWEDSNRSDKIDLAAPGVDVLSTSGGLGMLISVDDGNNGGYTLFGSFMDESDVPEDDEASSLLGLELADCGKGIEIEEFEDAAGKICLIERGETTFLEKAINCEEAGGLAALVYNNEDGSFEGDLEDDDVDIPVVALSREDGLKLLESIPDAVSVSLSVSLGYSYRTGTSHSSPHVAGVAAKVWSARPECTNVQVQEALFQTALDLGEEGRDDYFGHGLVQAVDAYNYLLGLPPPCGTGGQAPDPQANEDVTTGTGVEDPLSQTISSLKSGEYKVGGDRSRGATNSGGRRRFLKGSRD